MRWWPIVLVPALLHAEPVRTNAALFEVGRTWTYDVTTTTYDIANWGSLTRPPKVTRHAVVTCTAATATITCDGALEPAVAGRYTETDDGLHRDGALVLARAPKPFRKVTHDAAMHADLIQGLRGSAAGWCTFEDSSDVDPDGASRSQCFGPTGIQSGDFDGGGGDWRRVSYRLRTTRAAPAARTP